MNYGFRIATPDGVWVWTKGDYNAECCALRRDFWAYVAPLPAKGKAA